MKAGDILFVRGKTFISDWVRRFDEGEFSHMAIAVSNSHILEAQYYTKSRITPIYFDDYEIIDLNLTVAEQIHAVKTGIQLVGKWYDYIQILGYLLKNPRNNPNNLICSEMVGIILAELDKVDQREVLDLKPNELYKLLKERF